MHVFKDKKRELLREFLFKGFSIEIDVPEEWYYDMDVSCPAAFLEMEKKLGRKLPVNYEIGQISDIGDDITIINCNWQNLQDLHDDNYGYVVLLHGYSVLPEPMYELPENFIHIHSDNIRRDLHYLCHTLSGRKTIIDSKKINDISHKWSISNNVNDRLLVQIWYENYKGSQSEFCRRHKMTRSNFSHWLNNGNSRSLASREAVIKEFDVYCY